MVEQEIRFLLKKAALFYDYPPEDGDVFGQGRRDLIAEITDLYPHVINGGNFDENADALADVEVIFPLTPTRGSGRRQTARRSAEIARCELKLFMRTRRRDLCQVTIL